MTKRDAVREWTRAISRKTASNLNAMEPLVARAFQEEASLAPDEIPAWLRRSRAVTSAAVIHEQNGDTIRILQRANGLLRRRFGIDWADAAAVVFGEASRRGASPVSLARVLATGLRRDARERGA